MGKRCFTSYGNGFLKSAEMVEMTRTFIEYPKVTINRLYLIIVISKPTHERAGNHKGDPMTNDDMNEYWNGSGGEKWIRFQHIMDKSLMPFGLKVMEALELSSGEKIVDIGCGCGATSFDMALNVGSHGHVKGIDISEPILQEARSRAQLHKYHKVQNIVTFEQADAQNHQFDSSTFDVIFSRFGVMFFDDPVTAFVNIRKALKPGGRLGFVCWQTAKNNQWVSVPLNVVAEHMPLPPPADESGPFSLGDIDRLQRILFDAGYSNIEINKYEVPFNIGSNLYEAVSFITQIGPVSAVISQPDVDTETRRSIDAAFHEAFVPYETKYGIQLGASTWIVTAKNS